VTAGNAESLHEAFLNAVGVSRDVPLHVFRRVAFLVAGESVVFVDGTAVPGSESWNLTGQVLVVTDRRVVLAGFTDVAEEHRREFTNVRGPVTVATWSRAALVEVVLPPPAWNDDKSWDYADYSDMLPPEASLELRYAGQEPLLLPLSKYATKEHRRAILAVLPALMADLHRGT
jgi:hypothetical protein